MTQTDEVGVLTASDSLTSDATSFTLTVPVVDGPYTLAVLLDGDVETVVEGTSECETEVLDEVPEPAPAPEPVERAVTGAPTARVGRAGPAAMLLGGLALVARRRRRTG